MHCIFFFDKSGILNIDLRVGESPKIQPGNFLLKHNLPTSLLGKKILHTWDWIWGPRLVLFQSNDFFSLTARFPLKKKVAPLRGFRAGKL